MGDARALLASIGTSALLIIAVAAALLSISVVFAIGGFDGAEASTDRAALVLGSQDRAGSTRGGDSARTPLVVDPATRAVASRGSARSSGRSGRGGSDGPSVTASVVNDAIKEPRVPPHGDPPVTTDPAPPAAAKKPNVGDSVKAIGNDVSSTVKETGSNLGEATAPLGPTVSAAVQQVLNVVAAIVQQATNLLGNVLGAAPGK